MALEVALEFTFSELVSVVKEVKVKAGKLKPKLEEVEATLRSLDPVINDIVELNRRVGEAGKRETEDIAKILKEGKLLVVKCSKVRRCDVVGKRRLYERLSELENKLLKFLLHMQAHTARDVKHLRLAVDILIQLNLINLDAPYRRRPQSPAPYRPPPRLGAVRRCSSKNKDKAFKFRVLQLQDTIESLSSAMKETEESTMKGKNGTNERERESITRMMEDGKKIVRECSKVGEWNFVKRWRYQRKVVEMDNRLMRFHSLQLQESEAAS